MKTLFLSLLTSSLAETQVVSTNENFNFNIDILWLSKENPLLDFSFCRSSAEHVCDLLLNIYQARDLKPHYKEPYLKNELKKAEFDMEIGDIETESTKEPIDSDLEMIDCLSDLIQYREICPALLPIEQVTRFDDVELVTVIIDPNTLVIRMVVNVQKKIEVETESKTECSRLSANLVYHEPREVTVIKEKPLRVVDSKISPMISQKSRTVSKNSVLFDDMCGILYVLDADHDFAEKFTKVYFKDRCIFSKSGEKLCHGKADILATPTKIRTEKIHLLEKEEPTDINFVLIMVCSMLTCCTTTACCLIFIGVKRAFAGSRRTKNRNQNFDIRKNHEEIIPPVNYATVPRNFERRHHLPMDWNRFCASTEKELSTIQNSTQETYLQTCETDTDDDSIVTIDFYGTV